MTGPAASSEDSEDTAEPIASDVLVTSALGFVDAVSTPEARDDANAVPVLMRRVVAWLRPASGKLEESAARVDAFTRALQQRPDQAREIGAAIHGWLSEARLHRAFVGLGLFSRRGFAREVAGRLYERINPAPRDPTALHDLLGFIFNDSRDYDWVVLVSPARWAMLYEALSAPLDAETRLGTARHLVREAVHAVEMLATWIAAEEIDEDLLRLDPVLAGSDSAFIALNREMTTFVSAVRLRLRSDDTVDGTGAPDDTDVAHLFVMLGQCEEQVTRLRKRAVTRGSALGTMHLLERLRQTIRRIQLFLRAMSADEPSTRLRESIALFTRFVVASAEQQRLRPLLRRTVRRAALSITGKESNAGEQYITRDGAGLRHMWKSAAGAGVIIAVLALLKHQLKSLGLPPFPEAVLSSLNYGLGFVLVHVLHFTIATKQPAMTASRLANDIGNGAAGRANQNTLAMTMVDLVRSQFAAVLGNVVVALTLAIGIGVAVARTTGFPLLGAGEVDYQLGRLNPVHSGALVYAAIAGVWLFLSGVIAGAFDNRAAYLDLRARLSAHPLMTRLTKSVARQEGIADYVHEHYGAIMGNFIFGVLLGMTPYIGHAIGLPLDIRHVAFSSADLGYATASGTLSWGAFYTNLGFVLLIGGVNLFVSFWLALWLALRARETRLGSLPAVFTRFAKTLLTKPRLLLVPPSDR